MFKWSTKFVVLKVRMDSAASMNGPSRKIITAPSLKRGKDEIPPVNERVSLLFIELN